MGAADELARALAARDVNVGELIRQAEADARAEVAETLRGLFADDLRRRVLAHVADPPMFALVGIDERVIPLVRKLDDSAMRDEAQLESEVRAHNEMLLDAMGKGTVIPFRFGTAFPTRSALDEWVSNHRDELERELVRLRGKAEWAVEIVAGPPEGEPGRYLEERLATAVRPDVRGRLAAVAAEVAGNACLVAASNEEAFHATLNELEEEGYELRVTGPWPAYSFARLP